MLRHALDACPVAPGTVATLALPLAVSDLAAELALDRLKPDYLRLFPGGHFAVGGGAAAAGAGGSWSTASSPPQRGGPSSYLGTSSPSPTRIGFPAPAPGGSGGVAEERTVPCSWNPFVPLCRCALLCSLASGTYACGQGVCKALGEETQFAASWAPLSAA